MGIGSYRVFTASMNSTDSVVSAWNLGRAFSRVYLEIPTMASSSAFEVYAGASNTTLYQVHKDPGSTTTVQTWTFVVAASAGANGGIVPLPPGFLYYKIRASDSAPTNGVTFKLICSDD